MPGNSEDIYQNIIKVIMKYSCSFQERTESYLRFASIAGCNVFCWTSFLIFMLLWDILMCY